MLLMLLLYAADSRMEMSIKTHLVPSNCWRVGRSWSPHLSPLPSLIATACVLTKGALEADECCELIYS